MFSSPLSAHGSCEECPRAGLGGAGRPALCFLTNAAISSVKTCQKAALGFAQFRFVALMADQYPKCQTRALLTFLMENNSGPAAPGDAHVGSGEQGGKITPCRGGTGAMRGQVAVVFGFLHAKLRLDFNWKAPDGECSPEPLPDPGGGEKKV